MLFPPSVCPGAGARLHTDGAGRSFDQMFPTPDPAVVAPGFVWLAAPMAKSFDSRYLGSFGVNAIVGLMEPLFVIERHESGGRNVMNYLNDPWHTAGGYWQITNTTWRGTAPIAGVNLAQYPTAISAPCDVQRTVAGALFAQRGVLPWAPFNAALAAQVGYTGPMFDENGQAAFYGRAVSREQRRRSTEVWD